LQGVPLVTARVTGNHSDVTMTGRDMDIVKQPSTAMIIIIMMMVMMMMMMNGVNARGL